MSGWEILNTVAAMLCLLAVIVPFGYGLYRFHLRVKHRAERLMRAHYPLLVARLAAAGEAAPSGTPLRFHAQLDGVKVRVLSTYAAAAFSGLSFTRTGTASTWVSCEVHAEAPVVFTLRHRQDASPARGQQPAQAPAGTPEGWVLEALVPAEVARLDRPEIAAQLGWARGWRLWSDGRQVTALAHRAPTTVDELEGVMRLVAGVARA
ncbi:MAG: hypothetical protein JXX28_00170 [Deltaproteobacteria bacterium]|nr:hypothetical protein [Deltaproteobacteria bacterium]